MAGNVFTREGLAYQRHVIEGLQVRVKKTGREAGEAAGDGCDWHDNFGYEDATRQLEMASTRLRELETQVAGASVIVVIEQAVRVRIGNTIDFATTGGNSQITIGAWGESRPERGLVSYESPIASALIGREVGDVIMASLGDKQTEIEITDIHPPSYLYRSLIKELFVDTLQNES